MSEFPVLLVREWQKTVMHVRLPALERVVGGQSRVPGDAPLCFTNLPAIVCACGLYLIEVGDDGLGPRPVGPAGEI